MTNAMKTNKIMRGTFGRTWINGELYANVKSFEAKTTLNYEEVDVSGDLGKHQRYTGYTIEGTMILHKINSAVGVLLREGIRTGVLPEISIVSKLDDPSAYGAERVQFIEVTLDELTLIKFENGTLGEEEVPFKAADFKYLDIIS